MVDLFLVGPEVLFVFAAGTFFLLSTDSPSGFT